MKYEEYKVAPASTKPAANLGPTTTVGCPILRALREGWDTRISPLEPVAGPTKRLGQLMLVMSHLTKVERS
jgi:hypothetical protein